jgi:multicomponent Na+:H+ antiporter subunit G
MMAELIGSILILIGAVFLFSAGLGMLRMPDAYTRIQAGTKASTLGNMLVLAGLAFYHPGWTLKLVIVIYFVLMTNPISSHALARAAHAIKIPMTRTTVVDALNASEQSDRSGT